MRRLVYLRSAAPDASRHSFDCYLAAVFNWCGTISLAAETVPVPAAAAQPGDVLVTTGRHGHAVLIADVARNAAGRRQALALQGWLPAQSIYVVSPRGGGGWFDLPEGEPIAVPAWGGYDWQALRRFAS